MVCCGPPSTRTPYPVGTCENWALLWQVMHSAALQMGSISPPLPGGQDSKVLPIFRCARTLDVLLRRPLDIRAPVTRCYGEYCRAICSTLAIIAAILRRRVRERDHPEAASDAGRAGSDEVRDVFAFERIDDGQSGAQACPLAHA